MEAWGIVIVGAGPAGSATALALARHAPDLVPHILVLEKERHPRPKPCGGGLTFIGERVLYRLGLGWDVLSLPHVPVHHIRLQYGLQVVKLDVPYIFRVVHREELDAALVQQVRACGIEVREETPVLGLSREENRWHVHTPHGTLQADIIVGADGSRGVVRRALGFPSRNGPVARILEVLTPPLDPLAKETLRDHLAVFDFSVVRAGVQGYVWDFPSVMDGQPVMNRGIFDSRVHVGRRRGNLQRELAAALRARGLRLTDYALVGHPERSYDPEGVYSTHGAILVGDAAGGEPLLGEGISFALWYGDTVAPWVVEALERGDLSFNDYSRRLRRSPLGRHLTLRVRIARFVYARSDRFVRWGWRWLGRALHVLEWRVRRDMAREGLGRPGPNEWPWESGGEAGSLNRG